jgi:hypothetical protein
MWLNVNKDDAETAPRSPCRLSAVADRSETFVNIWPAATASLPNSSDAFPQSGTDRHSFPVPFGCRSVGACMAAALFVDLRSTPAAEQRQFRVFSCSRSLLARDLRRMHRAVPR